MRTIGLIGGMSWESSLEYYRIINETVKQKRGGFHSARIIMYSLDFAEIEKLLHQGRWDRLTEIMVDAVSRLEKGGADFLLICTNTMHKVAAEIEEHMGKPLLHIADAAAGKIKDGGLKKVGLLGTRFTMEEDFYRGRLKEKHGIEVIVPQAEQRQEVHEIIFRELVMGIITERSKEMYIKTIDNLAQRGAEGIILGCTEIPLLIKQEDSKVPLFDTTLIHAEAAAALALNDA